MTADLLAPDEFAELLDTPEFAAMPAHERARVFDAGIQDSRAWARENKLDAGFDGIEQALGVRYRPAEVDIQTSQQGPLKTAANAFANLGPEFVGGVVGGFARMGDAALEAVGISDPGQKSVLDRVAGAADSLQAEGELFYPTNPANPKAKNIGGGAGQGLALIGTAGLGAMAQIPRAGMYLPVLAGGAMGANQGIQTAEQMGIQNPLGKLGVGTGFAAIEAGTEMIGGIGGKFLPVVDGLKGAVLNVLTEGAEEVIGGTAQDALTVAAGQAVADPARPGFTETGYQLPSLNPLDERFLAQRGQEFLGGAAGGAVFAGVQALSNASVNDRTVPPPPANQTVPDAGNGAGSTPAAGADLSPEEADALPGDQALIANWEPIETALGTLAPVGGGNVIADFGIQRTPEAQAIVDAENAQRTSIEGQARGMQNMAGNGRPMIPDSPLGSYDLLDFINENPLNIPRKGTEAGRGGEYDWSAGFEMPAYYRKYLVSTERGFRPDELAQMAYDENLIREPSPDALIAAMQETMRTRTQYKAQFRQQRQELKQMEQQQVRFEKSQQQPTGKTQVPFDDLAPGDAFTINNEPVTIRQMEHDEDGNLTEIVIEDGKAFGVMSLDPQTRGGILVDKKSMQRAAPVPGMPSGTTLEQASNDPFSLTQATLPGPPGVDKGENAAQSGGMASTSGAAQNAEPSPGGLSEAEVIYNNARTLEEKKKVVLLFGLYPRIPKTDAEKVLKQIVPTVKAASYFTGYKSAATLGGINFPTGYDVQKAVWQHIQEIAKERGQTTSSIADRWEQSRPIKVSDSAEIALENATSILRQRDQKEERDMLESLFLKISPEQAGSFLDTLNQESWVFAHRNDEDGFAYSGGESMLERGFPDFLLFQSDESIEGDGMSQFIEDSIEGAYETNRTKAKQRWYDTPKYVISEKSQELLAEIAESDEGPFPVQARNLAAKYQLTSEQQRQLVEARSMVAFETLKKDLIANADVVPTKKVDSMAELRAQVEASYPSMPPEHVKAAVEQAWKRNQGDYSFLEGNDFNIANAVVRPYARHNFTDYESVIRKEGGKSAAREAIFDDVEGLLSKWSIPSFESSRVAGGTSSSAPSKPSTSAATTPAPASRATSDRAQLASGETNAFSSAEQTIVSNIRQAQLPRAKTPVGPIRAPGELVTLKQIRDHLLESTLLPRAGVRRFSQRALGIYKIKPETIRLRALNDLPTLAHEVGHAIHFRQLSTYRGGPAESWQGLYDSELMPLGQVTSAPNYTPDQVRNEGVAEFTRLWLTDPAAALKAAPRFASAWEMQMRALHPEMLERLRDSQRLIAQYTAMPGWERAKAQLVFDAEAQKPKRTWREWARRAYANWFNTLQPVYDTLRKIGEADGALAAEAQRIRDNLENHRGGWQSKVQADVEIMQTDLNGKVIGPALKNILADISPAEHADFSTYLALRRAKELRGRGIKSGFEDALQHLTPQTMAEMVKRYEPTRKKLDAYQQNLIKMMVQSGLLSQKTADAMREANRDYVPFYRLYEKLNGIDTGAAAGRNAGGLVDVGTGIRRIKGSDLAIIDPLQSILRNTFMFRKLAEQNQIGADFFDLLGQMQGHGQFGDKIATRMKPTKISHETVVNKLIEAGVIQDANEIDADLAITLYSAIERPDSKTGEVIVRKDGKATHWQLNDPLLYTALKNADADSVHLFKDSPALRAIFTIPARLMRFTATAGNPVFALKNWFRDQITAGVYSKTGFVPFWDGVQGAMKVITKHPDYNAWIMAGGKFSGLNASDKTYQAMIEELLPPQREARLAVRAMRSLRHVKKALTITSEILEEATRVQEFSRARAQGKNPMEAANLAKGVSMNFARAGQMSRKLNQIIPFFNAGLQDIDMIVRELANPKTRGAALMKGALYISIPSLIAWALGKDDEEIQNLPDWRKTQFWNFNLGPLAQLTGRPAFILSLPKPFLMGQLFGTSLERSLDQATARDPNGAAKAAQAILENTALHGDVTDFIPAALKPLVQIAFNRDTFRGQDIVPSNMQHLDKADQVLPTTSLTAQAIGKATGSSPLIIDSLLRGYLTGLGTLGSHGIDWAVTKATAGDRDNGPRTDLFEWQPFASFVGSPYAADANVGRFYAAADDMEGRLKQWNDRAPALDLKNNDDVQWWNKHRAEVMHYNNLVNPETKLTQAGQIRKLMRHLSDLNRAMKSTRNDPAMSPEQKRSTLIELSQTRNAAAKAGFALFPEPVRKKHY